VRVGVDGRSLVGGAPRGVAHYTSALLGALAAAFPEDDWSVLLPRGEVALVPHGVRVIRHPVPARLLFGTAAVLGRPRLDVLLGADCDVVWAPAPAPLAIGRTPFVLTVHDRSWERRPQDFTLYERAWHRSARPRRLARRASRVLCDTEAVREELIAVWRLPAGRVRAVPLAPRALGAPAAATRDGAPYFLFVGALEPRKAPDVLLDAFTRARAHGLDADLVYAGEGRLEARLAAPRVRIADRREPLADLYAGAIALVLPSWLEGFGLPPVEALSVGTPAIVSDLPAFRETLGAEGAVYVTPGDAAELADALLALAGEPALRERVLVAGRAAIAPLRWEATALRTHAVLAEAAHA
jgi:glycosyltransferase involved in cell wall biosynthesis